MANLLEQLNKGITARQATRPQSQTEQAQKVMQAKGGKAAGASGPTGGNLAEAQVISQADAASDQLQLQGAETTSKLNEAAQQASQQNRLANKELQVDQQNFDRSQAVDAANTREDIQSAESQALDKLSAEEMRGTDKINNTAQNELKKLAADRDIALDNIFSSFEQSKKELEQRKDAAKLEQLGFLMAMSDQAYVDEIQSIAKEQNLMDQQAYQEEMLRVTLGDNFSDFLDKVMFREGFNAQSRLNEAALADIDINAAIQMADAAIRDSNNQAIAQGAIDGTKAVVDHYADKEEKEAKKDDGGFGLTGNDEIDTSNIDTTDYTVYPPQNVLGGN